MPCSDSYGLENVENDVIVHRCHGASTLGCLSRLSFIISPIINESLSSSFRCTLGQRSAETRRDIVPPLSSFMKRLRPPSCDVSRTHALPYDRCKVGASPTNSCASVHKKIYNTRWRQTSRHHAPGAGGHGNVRGSPRDMIDWWHPSRR